MKFSTRTRKTIYSVTYSIASIPCIVFIHLTPQHSAVVVLNMEQSVTLRIVKTHEAFSRVNTFLIYSDPAGATSRAAMWVSMRRRKAGGTT